MKNPQIFKDYTEFQFDDGRWKRTVFRRGTGPAVIIIHEVPGLHPLVVRFADRVGAAGMSWFTRVRAALSVWAPRAALFCPLTRRPRTLATSAAVACLR